MDSSFYHCAGCQRRLPDGSTFCPQCGHKTSDAELIPMKDPPTAVFSAPVSVRSSWQLTLVRPDGEQVVYPFSDSVRIGRSAENDLPLQDHQISRYHALIEKHAAGYQISDLGSTNGTFVNRKRIMYPMKLRVGDTITIGQFRILVQRDSIPCGNCGKQVKSDYIFCAYCGEALTGLSMLSDSSKSKSFANSQTNPFEAPPIFSARPEFHQSQSPDSVALRASFSPQAERNQRAVSPEQHMPADSHSKLYQSNVPAAPQKIQVQPGTFGASQQGRWWFQACAIAFVVGLCTFAAVAAAGYWLYISGYLVR